MYVFNVSGVTKPCGYKFVTHYKPVDTNYETIQLSVTEISHKRPTNVVFISGFYHSTKQPTKVFFRCRLRPKKKNYA